MSDLEDINISLDSQNFETNKEYPKYVSHGIKISIGSKTITRFNKDDFLGTYTSIIWQSLANATLTLRESDEAKFYIITEGWDPRYRIERNGAKLKISLFEEDQMLPDGTKVSNEQLEGYTTSTRRFVKEVVRTGENLVKYWEDENYTNNSEMYHVRQKLQKLKDYQNEIDEN